MPEVRVPRRMMVKKLRPPVKRRKRKPRAAMWRDKSGDSWLRAKLTPTRKPRLQSKLPVRCLSQVLNAFHFLILSLTFCGSLGLPNFSWMGPF